MFILYFVFFLLLGAPPRSTPLASLFAFTTLVRSRFPRATQAVAGVCGMGNHWAGQASNRHKESTMPTRVQILKTEMVTHNVRHYRVEKPNNFQDRKSTRLNSSH